MFLLPLVVALAATDPTPAPSSAPAAAVGAPTPLKEIGRVQGRSICTSIVVHANAAIDGALENDRSLAIVQSRLNTTDLDNANVIQRRKAIDDLMLLAYRMREASSAGEQEVRRLRQFAEASPDPERKKELKAFADALGGAMYRQKKAAVDLDKALVIMQGRREVQAAKETAWRNSGIGRVDATGTTQGALSSNVAPESENSILQSIARDFQERAGLIASDEGIAADHSLGATTGC